MRKTDGPLAALAHARRYTVIKDDTGVTVGAVLADGRYVEGHSAAGDLDAAVSQAAGPADGDVTRARAGRHGPAALA